MYQSFTNILKGGVLALAIGCLATPVQAVTIDFSSGVTTFSGTSAIKYVEDHLTVASQSSTATPHMHLEVFGGSNGIVLQNRSGAHTGVGGHTPY